MSPDDLFHEGAAAKAAGRLDIALALYDAALAARPDFVQARVNLGNVLIDLGRMAEAIAHFDQVISLSPKYAQVYANKAVALGALNQHEAAIAEYDRALSIAPNFKLAQYGKALRLLQLGRWIEGWPLAEARWGCPSHGDRPYHHKPYWTGAEPINGETILVHAEQGLGDTIYFSRYLPLLAAAGADVLLAVQPPLHPLFQGWPGIKALLREGDPAPPYDRHVSLASLPLAFGTTRETIPPPAPQIAPPTGRVHRWAECLPKSRVRVGLAWSGNPKHGDDRNRSLPLTVLAPLIRQGADLGISFVALQTQRRSGDAQMLSQLGVADLANDLRDFGVTAAVAAACDLVISVDTSIAHLAGSLGLPLWLLLPFAADWRWGIVGEATPWYPSARLLRQPASGCWAWVIAEAAAGLSRL